jgi:putative transposase
MPRYIRAFVPGGTFFFTLSLLERRRRLLTEYIDDLRAVFTDARRSRPFAVEAIVVLPVNWAAGDDVRGLEME